MINKSEDIENTLKNKLENKLENEIIGTASCGFDLEAVVFGREKCEKDHSFGPAVRTHWLIHFVVSGKGIFKIDDKVYTINPGEMFVIPPYKEIFYKADSNDPWSYTWIGFYVKGELPKKLADVIRCPKAINIFTSMQECEKFTDGRAAFLNGKTWELFALLSEVDNNKYKQYNQYTYIDKAIEYIHSEYMNNISVEEIANRLNLDRTYFSVIFKKEVGLSPKQYILSYRMKLAVYLLENKNLSVTVAANSVGYSDVYVFSKMFKRYFGVSPSKYAEKP